MNDQQSKRPTSFWIISVIALMWNLMGVMSFFGQTFMSDKTLATYPEEQQALFEAVPMWLTFVFAIAVTTGTLGCIGLLMKKSWAVTLFLISLIAVLIQMSYNFFMTEAATVFGILGVLMSLLLIVVAGFLYFYAKSCKAKGWLS